MASSLKSLGFETCPTAPGLFRHSTRNLILACHVDDVIASGKSTDLFWLRDSLTGRYDLKSSMLGRNFENSGRFLKRTIRWTENGIVWSPDERHADEVVQKMGEPKPEAVHTTGRARGKPCFKRISFRGRGSYELQIRSCPNPETC